MISIKKDVIDVQQYIWRNNAKICGIQNSVSEKNFEAKIIDLAASIDVSISISNIEACDRLPNKKNDGTAKRTNVRFVNRKFVELPLAIKKKLKNPLMYVKNKLKNANLPQGKICINNNLFPYNKLLWKKCKILHDEKLSFCWILSKLICFYNWDLQTSCYENFKDFIYELGPATDKVRSEGKICLPICLTLTLLPHVSWDILSLIRLKIKK